MKAKVIFTIKLVILFVVTFVVSLFLVELAFRYQIQSQISLKMFGIAESNVIEKLSWQSARTIFEIIFQSVAFFIIGYITRISTKLSIFTAFITFLASHLLLRAGFSTSQAMSLINNLFLAFTASIFFVIGYKFKIIKIVNKFKNVNASEAGTDAA